MDFVGFSSDEEEERGDTLSPIEPAPAQVPPDHDPGPQLPPSDTPTSPSDTPTSHGVTRRGPRSSVLPEGCEVFLAESGEEVYTCSCKTSFTLKNNLLRHCQNCPNINASSFEPVSQSKRRRLWSVTDPETADMDSSDAENLVTTNQEQDAVNTACFKEDPEGTSLLKCELLKKNWERGRGGAAHWAHTWSY